MTTNANMEGILFGMGNPLLDISAKVDDAFLTKYNLKANDAILAEESHMPLYKELVDNYTVDYIAGGATQNTLRVVEWVLQSKNTTTFMGAVGDDDFANTLRQSATEGGVNVQYQVVPTESTGTCAVLLTGTNRSLCTKLGAANCFTKDHLEKLFSFAEKAQFYYISGFFLTVSTESMLHVAKHACLKNKPFMMNLSAPFISQFFTQQLDSLMPYVDILFGNETEAAEFAKVHNFETTDVAEIATKIVSLAKENKERTRMVIFTQGNGDVIVATGSGVEKFPVKKIPEEQIVDTNGAGDAFVGGFLAQYIQGKTVAESIECGIWTATEIIQQNGCTFPKDKKFPC